MSDDFRRRAASFDDAADLYQRARPSYPDEAVDWLLDRGDGRRPGRVLDLGAGTGKLTQAVVARGVDVVAVDPSGRMLHQLRAGSPTVQTIVGTAERIPLPDDSVDAVLAAQAWHWVDEERAVPEVRRVLRPGGGLGLIWNVRDEAVPWVARLSQIVGSSDAETYVQRGVDLAHARGAVSRFALAWSRPMTEESLVELVLSRSSLITATPERRDAVVAAVRELVRREFDGPFELPYRTHAYRAEL